MNNTSTAYASARLDGVLDYMTLKIGLLTKTPQPTPVIAFYVLAGLQRHPIWALDRMAAVVFCYCVTAKQVDRVRKVAEQLDSANAPLRAQWQQITGGRPLRSIDPAQRRSLTPQLQPISQQLKANNEAALDLVTEKIVQVIFHNCSLSTPGHWIRSFSLNVPVGRKVRFFSSSTLYRNWAFTS